MNKFDKGKLTQSILLIEIYLKALLLFAIWFDFVCWIWKVRLE